MKSHHSHQTANSNASSNHTSVTDASDSTSTSGTEPASHWAGPAWNNATEYPSFASNEFAHDRQTVEHLINRIEAAVSEIKPAMSRSLASEQKPPDVASLVKQLQMISELADHTRTLFWNLQTFVSMELTIDGQNASAQRLQSELSKLATKLDSALKPSTLFLSRAPAEIVERYLEHPHTSPERFTLQEERAMSDTLLSEAEETLLTTLRQNGPSAWGNLYSRISSGLKCKVPRADGSIEEMGLAQASGLLRDASPEKRKGAWLAIQEAWKTHEHSTAAILNGLAGWRIDVAKRRSHTREQNFLDLPLHLSRIQRDTLEAMMSAVRDEVEVPRRAMRALARGLGKTKMDAWDLLAPAPRLEAAPSNHRGDHRENHLVNGGTKAEPNNFHQQTKINESRRSFKEGLHLIRNSFAAVDPALGDFVDTMEKNSWIEGRILPKKSNGAFCARFPKSRTPRVFQTYMGSISDIRTLAHELGHAYHAWVMRDLPNALLSYPMTLAETASIFAETAFADHLYESPDIHSQREIAWQNAESAAGFLLNIPARFEFEKNFYERRTNSFVTPDELNELTEAAWKTWYGDTLASVEQQFWMTKLHFSIAGVSFYNFPYTFGYLFSLGIYAQRKTQGDAFFPAYNALLRDTGSMTAEDLVKRHLGEDITKPDFWKKSLRIVDEQVQQFEALLPGFAPQPSSTI